MAINIVSPKKTFGSGATSGIASDFALVQERFPKIGEKISLMWGTVGLQGTSAKPSSTNVGAARAFLCRLFPH